MAEFHPLINQLRKGTADDPYIQCTDSRIIKNAQVELSEIPDFDSKLVVTGSNQTWFHVRNEPLSTTRYTVDYTAGRIHFDKSQEGKSVVINYMGIGAVAISAGRVYTKRSGNTVVETVEDFIDKTAKRSDELEVSINKSRRTATEIDRIRIEASYKIADLQQKIDNSSILPQEPVQNRSELYTKYPSPQIGWTVQVISENIVRRWDGFEWAGVFNLEKFEGFNVILSKDSPFGIYGLWGIYTDLDYAPQSKRVKVSSNKPYPNQMWGVYE